MRILQNSTLKKMRGAWKVLTQHTLHTSPHLTQCHSISCLVDHKNLISGSQMGPLSEIQTQSQICLLKSVSYSSAAA